MALISNYNRTKTVSFATDIICSLLTFLARRLEVQDKVRRLAKEPREDEQKDIQRLRQLLLLQLHDLDVLQQHLNLPAAGPNVNPMDTDDAAAFENLDENDEVDQILIDTILADQARPATHELAGAQPDDDTPESRLLAIPSNYLTGNHPQRHVELDLRLRQASRCLQALRDAIADKSFQFSHVIRVAPRKGVRTRARATIAKLNHRIAHLARVYGRCRRALTRLDADNTTLDKYKILLKDHLKSSTALLNPNEPGSTRMQLSWIWQTAGDVAGETPESMRECK